MINEQASKQFSGIQWQYGGDRDAEVGTRWTKNLGYDLTFYVQKYSYRDIFHKIFCSMKHNTWKF